VIAGLLFYLFPRVKALFTSVKTKVDEITVGNMNDAASEAKGMGLVGPGTRGFSKIAALEWYRSLGIITHGNPDLGALMYKGGSWRAGSPPSIPKELEARIAPLFSIDPTAFFQSQGFTNLQEASDRLGGLDKWARKRGYFSFAGFIYTNYGGKVSPVPDGWFDDLMDAAITMPKETMGIIACYPELIADSHLQEWSQMLNDGIAGKYGPDYPSDAAQDCLGRLIVNASTREGDGWMSIDVTGVDCRKLDLSGAKIAKVSLSMDQINQATAYEGTDFTGVDIKGFDPSKKTLRGAIMPEDATSPRLFRWTTDKTPAPGTIWVDGKRPWG